jgi:hypothetical protein
MVVLISYVLKYVCVFVILTFCVLFVYLSLLFCSYFVLCFVVFCCYRCLCIFIFVCTSVGLLPPGESPTAVSNNNIYVDHYVNFPLFLSDFLDIISNNPKHKTS